MQVNDVQLYVPVILIRVERIEVVPQFRYLGLLDTEDGALGVEIQARIFRMKQRFKEFEGRVFCNHGVSTLPRMQVFKCMVLTNGMYASEVWNYTHKDMDRLEKHYFRLMRSTMFLEKNDTTYMTVLRTAREQGVVKVYPIECYVQRQQLKFLWKILHLGDLALQRIVLHSKLDPQYKQGRGGRQRTYKQCIIDAMRAFGVTMAQCMEMKQQDWDLRIEEIGLETAMQKWEARPQASKSIDKEWRKAAGQTSGQIASMRIEPLEEADDGEAESDDEESDEGREADNVMDNEFAQVQESQEEEDGRADDEEDVTPWDGDARTEDQDVGEPVQRTGVRQRNSRAAEERYGNATGAHQDGQSRTPIPGWKMRRRMVERRRQSGKWRPTTEMAGGTEKERERYQAAATIRISGTYN